jgi:hypothetical protein
MTRILVAFAGAAILSACAGPGVTTVDRSYDPTLIRQIGSRSNAVANVVPGIRREAASVGRLDNTKADQDAVLVLQGKLDKLTPNDVVLVAKASRRSFTAFETALSGINQLASHIESDRVDPAAYSKLSSGAKKFVGEWNGYLTGIADETRHFHSALVGEGPYFNELQAVLRAAYETTGRRSVARFDRVRRKFISDLQAESARMRATLKSIETTGRSGTPTDRQFATFVNNIGRRRPSSKRSIRSTRTDGSPRNFIAAERLTDCLVGDVDVLIIGGTCRAAGTSAFTLSTPRCASSLRRHLNHADRRGPGLRPRLHSRRPVFGGAAGPACAMPRTQSRDH